MPSGGRRCESRSRTSREASSAREPARLLQLDCAGVGHWRSRNRFYHEQVKELVAGAVVPGRRVLDIGCGTGDVLATVKPSAALDSTLRIGLTQLAREKYPDLQFETFDGR